MTSGWVSFESGVSECECLFDTTGLPSGNHRLLHRLEVGSRTEPNGAGAETARTAQVGAGPEALVMQETPAVHTEL